MPRAIDRLDRLQRRRDWIGLPVAVVYKFFDDRGPYLAALVTYYGFVSLFPLLLLFFSAAGFFLQGHPDLRDQLEHSALRGFPIIGPQLRTNVSGLHGSGAGLAIGVLGSLYGGVGVMQAAQAGFNRIYGVPRNEQPSPLRGRLRSLGLLALLGTAVLLSTAASIVVATANGLSDRLGPELHAAGYVATFAINAAMFTAAFQLLTARDLRLRRVLTGGLIAAGLWLALQTQGTAFLSARLGHANEVYGTFALVLGALGWIYLEALVLMLAAEINVVLHGRLWPRALLTPFTDDVQLTAADRTVYEMYVATQRYKGFERVTAQFDAEPVSPDRPRRCAGTPRRGACRGRPRAASSEPSSAEASSCSARWSFSRCSATSSSVGRDGLLDEQQDAARRRPGRSPRPGRSGRCRRRSGRAAARSGRACPAAAGGGPGCRSSRPLVRVETISTSLVEDLPLGGEDLDRERVLGHRAAPSRYFLAAATTSSIVPLSRNAPRGCRRACPRGSRGSSGSSRRSARRRPGCR